jgi:ABC-type bacteriocin/lantibiotic exporter with double-glycine peptidase domain
MCIGGESKLDTLNRCEFWLEMTALPMSRVVLQEPVLFVGTIGDNIKFGECLGFPFCIREVAQLSDFPSTLCCCQVFEVVAR